MRGSRALIGVLAVLAVGTAGCGDLVSVTPAGHLELAPPAETSVVVAADGSVLAELHAEQDRDVVPLSRIPKHLRDAVVAIEDARFYAHGGVDVRSIARALVTNVREGGISEGGSTITQQLVKNALLSPEQTIDRKLAEASLALQLERSLSKDEILERYLNTVYFGQGAYGAQAAARRYFGVDVDALDLAQSALLAGLLRSPGTDDPRSDPDAAVRRRSLVLSRMVALDLVDAAAAEAAAAAPLELAPAQQRGWQAPYYVAHVLELVQHDPAFAVLGPDPAARADRVFRGGLRIETALDPGWQAAAEESVAATLDRPDDPRAAVVALHPPTGEVRALVGGRDYDDPDDPHARFNLATEGRRQPGSTFKAVVLAAALAAGNRLDEVWPGGASLQLEVPGSDEPWRVRNYDDRDHGQQTLRAATATSTNVTYARLVERVGPDAVADLARDLGVGRDLRPLPSLALGAQEVSPLELATVNATFATGGVRREPVFVTRITGPDGTVLWQDGRTDGERVLDPAVAYLLTDALRGVVEQGTGQGAVIQRPLAGKTGTTQEGADAWFAGYTPDLAAAVWVGFPEAQLPMVPPRTRIRVEGGTWPAEIFARFGLRALEAVPAAEFAVPETGLATVRIDIEQGCLATAWTPPERVGERAYLDGTAPTEPCEAPEEPPAVAVPDVSGLPVGQAVARLEAAGFSVEQRAEHNAVLPPGYVVRQEPAAGPEVALPDGYVAVLWSSSAERRPVAVPDVLGAPLDEAREALESAGFVVEVEQACPGGGEDCTGARQRPGTVWEQVPDAGRQVPPHSVLRLSAYPGG